MRLIVIGGGISGLATAIFATEAGHDVVCVDAGQRPGGLIRSERIEGFLCEAGPQAVLDDAPDTRKLIDSVGLGPRIVRGNPDAKRRFIFAGGALHALPGSPPALLRSRLLSASAKLRLLREPLVRRAAISATTSADPEESVLSFGVRRLGREAATKILATATIGIYAADADRLGMQMAFPRLSAMEREHGSLFRALLASRRAGRKPAGLVSFVDGLEEFPAAIARALGGRLVRARATALEPRNGGGWRVHVESTPHAPSVATQLEADAVVVTTDAHVAASLLAPTEPDVAGHLRSIEMVPLAVACLGFRGPGGAPAVDIGMDLRGYGFLVARGEEPRLLGCQYESSVFAGRAPTGGVLLRAILGGLGDGFDPAIVDQSEDVIAQRALADIARIGGLRASPDIVRVWKYPRALPLYDRVHGARVRAIDAALAAQPGLHLLGQAVRGVGVNEGVRAAAALVATLSATA